MSKSNIVVFGSVRSQPPIYQELRRNAANAHKGNPHRPEIRAILTRCWRFVRISAPPVLPALPYYPME